MTQQIASPVLILGARSDIGRALALAYAESGCSVLLGARRAADLEADCTDISLRFGGEARAVEFDVNAPDPDSFFRSLPETPGTVVMVVGLLGDHERSLADDDAATLVMATNYDGPSRHLLAAARAIAGKAGATIIGISSVAGDRGRGSNFIYGSAQAGFTAFLSGLRNSLAGKGIHVMTVKPGFVDTRMTAGMDLPQALTAQPQAVAQAVVRAHGKGANVIYVKPVWRLIMLIIRSIPEFVFKKLKL